MIWTIALLLLEMSCDIIISYISQFPILTELLCRLYILSDASWFVILIAYIRAFLEPEKYKSVSDVFSEKSMLILMVISSIMFFASCFLELTYTSASTGEFNVIGGKAVFVLYAVFFTSIVFVYRALSKNLDRVTLMKRLPMILYLLLFAIMKLFQYFYTDVNDLGFLFAFCVVSMYFTIENQDIKLVSELELARIKAEEADKAKTDFLSKMSHEIRTPMNAIVGFSENLMKKDNLNEKETIDDVRNIYNAGKNLMDIINNILLFSKIESGNAIIENSEYSICDLIDKLEDYIDSKIEDINIKYNIHINDNLYINCIGDKEKVYRLLEILINRIISMTSEGIIEVIVSNYLKDNFVEELR